VLTEVTIGPGDQEQRRGLDGHVLNLWERLASGIRSRAYTP
jgi:hypothetical protein